ncbi:MAG TPA: di-heme oxidoredictase family protein [Blastocatellia bacterium]|nr:di-heme oxidoredictase family protein [Blastocatellia bacterium]
MKPLKLFTLVFFVAALALPAITSSTVQSQGGVTEAPTGFDDETNGLVDQLTHEADEEVFAEQEFIEDGLGPVYNAQSCGECHQNPVTGGISQITEMRAGIYNGSIFFEHEGGSLIHSRAIHADIQERMSGSSNVRAFRTSLNTLGDGFVECIDSNTLLAIANSQPSGMRGQLIQVPLLEAPGQQRAGRFGWKNQHTSLVSFSADAYLNEMGITTPFLPTENTSNGRSVADYDPVGDPEDDGVDVEIFARFMRATKAPPRDEALAVTSDAQIGSQLFDQIGCAVCHVRNIVTAPPGTLINGGTFRVPAALGNKRIHPFSDFLLHDVGTGDGIVQNGPQSTRNKLRTPPLWGLRTRNRLMHDGESLTRNEAILRHAGEATPVINNYRALSNTNKNRLITFLNSL